jgi:hypothetical protein
MASTSFMLPPQTDFRKHIKSECSKRSKLLHTTIFGTAFSSSDEFLVGVSSDGRMIVWDLGARTGITSSSSDCTYDGDSVNTKKRKTEDTLNCKPCFEFQVCDGALYDVQFVPKSNGESLLLACGDEGIFLYDDFLSSLKSEESINFKIPAAKSQLRPNLNSYGSMFPAEFNRISYDSSSGQLFGAAGDGCGYIWDIHTSQLVGNLGHKNPTKRSYSDCLHAIKVIEADSNAPCHGCVLTGGEGILSMWSGKDRKLIDTFDCTAAGGSHSKNGKKHNRQKCWISSIDVDDTGDWSVIGGGRSSKSTGGFLQLFNLHSRSIMSSTFQETVETIHDVAYHPTGILSVGNDGVVSSWPSLNLTQGRTGRAWGSSPASYSISVHPENGMVATGNVSSSVDCFTEYLTKTCTLTR